MDDLKESLREKQRKRADDRVAKLKQSDQPFSPTTDEKKKRKTSQESPFTFKIPIKKNSSAAASEEANDWFSGDNHAVPYRPVAQPVLSSSEQEIDSTDSPQAQVSETFQFRNAIERERVVKEVATVPVPLAHQHAEVTCPAGVSTKLEEDRYHDEVNPFTTTKVSSNHTGQALGARTNQDHTRTLRQWRQWIRVQLEKVAIFLAKLIVLLLLAGMTYYYFKHQSDEVLPVYCSDDIVQHKSCIPCPLHGVCKEGMLAKCAAGYVVGREWSVFGGSSTKSQCKISLITKLWIKIKWIVPYVVATLLVVLTWRRRSRNAEKASQLGQRWLRDAWMMLCDSEESLPLVRRIIKHTHFFFFVFFLFFVFTLFVLFGWIIV
jgi:hypothetical protein